MERHFHNRRYCHVGSLVFFIKSNYAIFTTKYVRAAHINLELKELDTGEIIDKQTTTEQK